MTNERIRCGRCGMSFRIAEPTYWTAEFTACAEPFCGRRFWQVNTTPESAKYWGAPSSAVVVGITPEDHKAWML